MLHLGQLTATPQDEVQATAAPPLTKEQGLIDWNLPAEVIGCQVRGLDPWPTAYTYLNGKRMRLFGPSVIAGTGPEAPGTVIAGDNQGLLIAAGRDRLLVREVQLEGAKRLSADAFLRGRKLTPGSVLGS